MRSFSHRSRPWSGTLLLPAVRYASGDCGTAVIMPVGTRWAMDERTEEQC